MEIQENIVNKVAQSGLISFDPASLNTAAERIVYDIKDNLFQGLLLREKDFREFIKQCDWSQYLGKHVAVICSSDAIVPTWAYMLLANKMQPFAATVIFGSLETLETVLFDRAVQSLDMEQFRDQRVVIKGCGDIFVPVSAYSALTSRLTTVVKSIMYGEPCSTVPVYKRKD
ncbi:DUF2480 family protein [Arcticibacter eurypsychrophilus]|uniref:DUF2480 family protein n=1 Tax=Arcticibacter eurypsychrophilus TaxID=1434752 RepID=UPI00084DCCA4|nr:DUF2480 family protein [Arcticibacter eurypsychrophilus]